MNQSLRRLYDEAYKQGGFFTFDNDNETRLIVDCMDDWIGVDVLEIGCGEGRLAHLLGASGAEVTAVDYSEEAIRKATMEDTRGVTFTCGDVEELDLDQYDVVILQGVLEHLDTPFPTLKRLVENHVRDGGVAIVTCPGFLNPRGYVWMTLQLLFDVPMSLTDLHFLSKPEFERFCRDNEYALEIRSTDLDWAAGNRTIIDFDKRLRNALTDADMDTGGVDRFLEWFETALPHFQHTEATGANVCYQIRRQG